jgi:hypothetical protein
VFGDAVISTTILGRLLRRSHVVAFRRDSYGVTP